MVTFNQAYWYINNCPLRKLDTEVCHESDSSKALHKLVNPILIDYFNKDLLDIRKDILDSLNIKAIKTGLNKESIIRRLNQLIINYEIWKTKHTDTEVLVSNLNTSVGSMDFNIDIARYKPLNSRIQLIWFNYAPILPSLAEDAKLVEKAQWNARGFELSTKERPMQLTYFFPLVGTEYSVLYNIDNGYNVVADLIDKEVFYTKPSKECDICDACPMTWAGYKGELNGK